MTPFIVIALCLVVGSSIGLYVDRWFTRRYAIPDWPQEGSQWQSGSEATYTVRYGSDGFLTLLDGDFGYVAVDSASWHGLADILGLREVR